MNSSVQVAVLGASGFVGSAATQALEDHGFQVRRVPAPRLPPMGAAKAVGYLQSEPGELADLASRLRDVDAVVNAAGVPDATSADTDALVSANGVLPGLIALACTQAGVGRFVHVSSAAVQGRLPVLDESETVDAFSSYSESKVLGEQMVRRFSNGSAVIYRPPGVHGADRRVTRMVARIASSPFAAVARPGALHSPQALISNVAAAIAFLATTPRKPPAVVIHPWEGLTTADVLNLLGGHAPRQIPAPVARAVVQTLTQAGRALPQFAGFARRLDMLWFGQQQAASWLSAEGWVPPAGRDEWGALGRAIREGAQSRSTQGRTS